MLHSPVNGPAAPTLLPEARPGTFGRRLMAAVALAVLALPAWAADIRSTGYTLQVKAVVTAPRTLDVQVKSTVPDTFTLSAHLERHGMKDEDLYLGAEEMDVRLVHGQAHFGLNASGMADFPSGRYYVVVELHLGHPHNLPLARRLHLTGVLSAKATVAMTGTGPSAAGLERRVQAQHWLDNTLQTEAPWDPAKFAAHLGPSRELSLARSDLNLRIFKLYYPQVDRTVRVNLNAGVVLGFQPGQDHWSH